MASIWEVGWKEQMSKGLHQKAARNTKTVLGQYLLNVLPVINPFGLYSCSSSDALSKHMTV